MFVLKFALVALYFVGGAAAVQWRGREGSSDLPSDFDLVVIFVVWPLWMVAMWNYSAGWRRR